MPLWMYVKSGEFRKKKTHTSPSSFRTNESPNDCWKFPNSDESWGIFGRFCVGVGESMNFMLCSEINHLYYLDDLSRIHLEIWFGKQKLRYWDVFVEKNHSFSNPQISGSHISSQTKPLSTHQSPFSAPEFGAVSNTSTSCSGWSLTPSNCRGSGTTEESGASSWISRASAGMTPWKTFRNAGFALKMGLFAKQILDWWYVCWSVFVNLKSSQTSKSQSRSVSLTSLLMCK